MDTPDTPLDTCIRHLDEDRRPHCESGPAITFSDGSTEWYYHGQLHREGGPAVESRYGRKEWWLLDRRHRADGPAITWTDGSYEYWVQGTRHREGGPAIHYVKEKKRWYAFSAVDPWANFRGSFPRNEMTAAGSYSVYFHRGQVHRLGGHAIKYPDGKLEWVVNGRKFTENEYYLFVDQLSGEVLVPPGRKLFRE